MISLIDFIKERLESGELQHIICEAAYDKNALYKDLKSFDILQSIIDIYNNVNENDQIDDDDIIGKYAGTEPPENLKDYKIFRKFIDSAKIFVKTHKKKYFLDENGNNPKLVRKKDSEVILIFGDGSDISTKTQETTTVAFWNYLINNNFKDVEELRNHIKSIDVLDERIKDSKKWIDSTINQCKAIQEYISKEIGLEINNFKAIYIDGSFPEDADDKGIQLLNEFINFRTKYKELVNTSLENDKQSKIHKMDVIDPTDILLYNISNNEGDKEEKTGILNDPTLTYIAARQHYYNEYIATNKIIPISLKQIVNGKASYNQFNFDASSKMVDSNKDHGDICKITRISKIDNENPNSYIFEVTGNIKFGDISAPEEDKPINENTFIITLRSFGKNNIAMDIKVSDDMPPIGKISVAVWKHFLSKEYKKQSQDLKDWIKALQKFCKRLSTKNRNQNKKDWEALEKMVMNGLKIGHYCLPFVLIH